MNNPFQELKDMPLTDWLQGMEQDPDNLPLPPIEFPSDKVADEYCATIESRTEEEVLSLLFHFLPASDTYGSDKDRMITLQWAQQNEPSIYRKKMRSQYYKRLRTIIDGDENALAWEGITWVLDLLPHSPKLALEALNAYVIAHLSLWTDRRISGMYDAMEVIRAKFIGAPRSVGEAIQLLLDLKPREFEHLVKQLYKEMGYETILTPQSKDGGRDIVATKTAIGATEHLLVECKLYTNTVPVAMVRALLGVVSDEKVNKGVLVTTNRFSSAAKVLAKTNPRLELISGEQLVLLLNEHLGSNWPLNLDRLIINSERDSSGNFQTPSVSS